MMKDFYNFGITFSERLSEEKIECSLDSLNCNEWGVALETFCDYLCEDSVKITRDEYIHLIEFNKKMGMSLSFNLIKI